MNISLCTGNAYRQFHKNPYFTNGTLKNKTPDKDALPGCGEDNNAASFFKRKCDEAAAENEYNIKRLRQKLKELKREDSSSEKRCAPVLGEEKPEDKKTEKKESSYTYNYKEVASKIQSAKNSISAGQALLAAKRKVLEVKRKITSGSGDPEELQLALTHAKRMEITAKRKKHHLELEEMAVIVQNRDEELKKAEESGKGLRDAVLSAEEEEINSREDDIFEEREDMMDEASESLEDASVDIQEEMLKRYNELISGFGEEELKELEKTMEFLEEMEVIDPHMSREDLEDLKRKHRNEENKAMVKADMDYLKGMIKHQAEKAMSLISGGFSAVSTDNPMKGADLSAVFSNATANPAHTVDIPV